MSDIKKTADFKFPVNKIGALLLEKAITSLVADGVLKNTIYDIVDDCSKFGLNRNSLLTELVNIRGHQILWEIENSKDLYYEICRRYQDNENVWLSLCAIWKYIEPETLNVDDSQYDAINCEVIDYTLDINWRLSAFDYLVSNQERENKILKKKLEQFIKDSLEIIANTIMKNLYSDIDSSHLIPMDSANLNFVLTQIADVVFFLVAEILKSTRFDAEYQNKILKHISLREIECKIYNKLQPYNKRIEAANFTINSLLSGFFYTVFYYLNQDKKQTITNIKKHFESEINSLKPQIKTWFLDAVMELIDKYSLVCRK